MNLRQMPVAQGGAQPTAEMKINPSNLDDVICDECENYTFVKVSLMKRLPALISPTGQETFMPMDVFACNACNHVNKRFIQGMGGWFKDSDTADVADNDSGVRDEGIIEGSDLPGLEEVPSADSLPMKE